MNEKLVDQLSVQGSSGEAVICLFVNFLSWHPLTATNKYESLICLFVCLQNKITV